MINEFQKLWIINYKSIQYKKITLSVFLSLFTHKINICRKLDEYIMRDEKLSIPVICDQGLKLEKLSV